MAFGPNENKSQTEEIRTAVNPLSIIPAKVNGARETCIEAFRNAEKAFGSEMGPSFLRALGKVGETDFHIGKDDEGNTISTRLSDGIYLSLSVDSKTVTLTLIDRNGKEDMIKYDGKGKISRVRRV
ncbi:MAG: hypothetical protein QXH30_02015 [Candidatus Bilamarchaeaceae archaeon]